MFELKNQPKNTGHINELLRQQKKITEEWETECGEYGAKKKKKINNTYTHAHLQGNILCFVV